jgi:hypothetical protein
MSLTYTNQIKLVLDGIEKLIEDEFDIPVMDIHKGNESFVINPIEDTLEEMLSTAHIRNYDFSIIYTMVQGEVFVQIKDHLTNRAERLKRLLFNNTVYDDGADRIWYDGQVPSIIYSQSEDDPSMWIAEILFSCSTMEII